MKEKSFIWPNRIFPLCMVSASVLIYVFLYMGITDIMALQFLTEVLLAAPVLIYYLWNYPRERQSLFHSFGIKTIRVGAFFLLIPIAICVCWISGFINSISQLFVMNEIGVYVGTLADQYPFVVTFFVTAIMPAFCEEMVFRGMIYQGYRKYSMLLATILSAVLFALMHTDINQMSYALIIGVCLAFVNEAAGSMLPSMLIHMYINGRSTVLLYSWKSLIEMAKKEYDAAVLAGNSTVIERILKDMAGIDLASEDPFRDFLQQGIRNADASSWIAQTALLGVFGIAGFILLIWALSCVTGRKEHMKLALRMRFCKEEIVRQDPLSGEYVRTYKKRNPLSFITVPLILGIVFCLFMTVLKLLG